jgi:PBSX family phage terminase large subunit
MLLEKQRMLSYKQAKVIHNAHARWNILSGAVRSGKTYGSFFLLPSRTIEQGEGNFLLVGKTERTLKRNIIDPLRELYGPDCVSQVYGDGLVDIFGRRCYVVGANDERAVTKIQGIGLVYAYGDEVTTWPESFFEMLKSRLDKPGAKFDGTCNPGSPHHWLKQFIDTTDGRWLKHFHFQLDDNPFLDQDFVEALKTEYTGVWYQRYVLGQWVIAEGVVYDMFDATRHVTADIPNIKKYWVGVDYGTSNATAFVLLGIGSDNRLYALREYRHEAGSDLARSKTDAQYAEDFVNWLGDIKPEWIFIDPSAKSFRLTLWNLRGKYPALFKVAAANNEVLDGIRKISSLLSAEKIFIHKSCKGLQEEFTSYAWDPKAQERGEDKPIKEHDHSLDALRYAINGIGRYYNLAMDS